MLSVLKAPFEVGLGENPRCKFDASHRGFVSVKKAMIESGVIVCGVRLFCPRHPQDLSPFGGLFYPSVVWKQRVVGEDLV